MIEAGFSFPALAFPPVARFHFFHAHRCSFWVSCASWVIEPLAVGFDVKRRVNAPLETVRS